MAAAPDSTRSLKHFWKNQRLRRFRQHLGRRHGFVHGFALVHRIL